MGWRRIAFWVIVVDAVILIIAVVAARALAGSGAINVGADRPPPRAVDRFLMNASEASSERHAKGLTAPPLDEPARISRGFQVYDKDCVMCHGSPGAVPGPIGKGQHPDPPDLADSAKEMDPGQLFWVTKHGIQMTGMPAWAKTLSDDRIWDVVAFMEKLPHLTGEQYQALSRQQAANTPAAP